MYFPIRIAAISAPILALLVAGCDSGTDPDGDLGDLNPGQVESGVDALIAPAQTIVSPSSAVQSAFPTLMDQGLSYDRTTSWRTGALLGDQFDAPPIAADLVFPPELRGETFVYDELGQAWEADSTRTGAPSGGVRVIWYGTDASGALLLPLEEEGYVDLTDEDDGEPLSQLGLRLVDETETGSIVLSQLTQGYQLSAGTQWTEHFEAEGYYGGGSTPVNFTIVSDAVGDSTSGDQEFDLSIGMVGPEADYTLEISGSEAGATGAVQQNVIATVIRTAVVTELDLDLTIDDGGNQSGSGTVSHAGTVRARVTVNGSDFSYTDGEGRTLSGGDARGVDSLVRTLYLAGLTVLLQLPLLLL